MAGADCHDDGCLRVRQVPHQPDAFAGMGRLFNFYNPTGALPGVSTSAIVVWLVAWYLLARRWGEIDVNMRKVSIAAFVLLAIGFAFTFPPIMDWIQGK